MSDEVVSEAARREDTLRQVLRVIGYPLNLRRVELTHSVVGVRGQVHAVGEKAWRYHLVVTELVHS